MENAILCRKCSADLDFNALEANLPWCLPCRQAFVLDQLGLPEFRRKKSKEELNAERRARRKPRKPRSER